MYTIFFVVLTLFIVIIKTFSFFAQKTQDQQDGQYAEMIAKHKRRQSLKNTSKNKNVSSYRPQIQPPPVPRKTTQFSSLQTETEITSDIESQIVSPPVFRDLQKTLSEQERSAKLSKRHLQSNLSTSSPKFYEDENFPNILETQSSSENSNPIAEKILTLMERPHSMQQAVLLAEILKQPNFD
ncbi:MAG: hypothetical protein LBT05_11355 [Planctomycetaceae bacterium]|nr:hypothetical protein [Planctomycetaceae bacterium]